MSTYRYGKNGLWERKLREGGRPPSLIMSPKEKPERKLPEGAFECSCGCWFYHESDYIAHKTQGICAPVKTITSR